MNGSAPDCLACGACCRSRYPGHVPLTGDDHARLLPSERETLVRFEGIRCFMRLTDGACVNLVEEDGRWACAIYERRPQVCRDLERGGPACDVIRERAGL